MCVMPRDCPAFYRDVQRGVQPSVCGYQHLVPITCCPKSAVQVPGEEEAEDKEKRVSQKSMYRTGGTQTHYLHTLLAFQTQSADSARGFAVYQPHSARGMYLPCCPPMAGRDCNTYITLWRRK